MNNIQKLIDELEEQRLKMVKEYNTGYSSIEKEKVYPIFRDCETIFKQLKQKLTLLLNAEAETNGEKDCKNDGNAV